MKLRTSNGSKYFLRVAPLNRDVGPFSSQWSSYSCEMHSMFNWITRTRVAAITAANNEAWLLPWKLAHYVGTAMENLFIWSDLRTTLVKTKALWAVHLKCRRYEQWIRARTFAYLGSMNKPSASTSSFPDSTVSPSNSILPFTQTFRPSTFVVSAFSTTYDPAGAGLR